MATQRTDADGPARTGPRAAVVARIFLVAAVVLALVLARPAVTHARAAGVLLRAASPSSDALGLRNFGAVQTAKVALTLPAGDQNLRAYRYEPASGPSVNGIVLVHGVHFRGIDEPQLVRLAEAIAGAGITVLTPEIPSLADYHLDRAAVLQIGAAAHDLRDQLGGAHAVGVIGISFAGSLALLAAADPKVGPDIGFVVTIGSYDDLARVCRFYATGSIERPDGQIVSLRPHDYGPVVWVYSHLEDFYPKDSLDDVRATLREWLHDEHTQARVLAARLPEGSRSQIEALFDGDMAKAAPGFLADVDRHASELAVLSPHDQLGGIKVAVFAMHGSDDRLIPPSETLWLAHDLPPGILAYALISRALTHVELGDASSFTERLLAVHFMAGVLAAAQNP